MTDVLSADRFSPMPHGCEKGEIIKISLPGERCWAEIQDVLDDRTLRVRIDNHVGRSPSDIWPGPEGEPPIKPLHSYKFNDVIEVRWTNKAGYIGFYCKNYEEGLPA